MAHWVLANDEQKEFAAGAKEIVMNELASKIEEYENMDGGLGKFPEEVFQILVDTGYFAVNLPEEYGGLGMDAVTEAMIIEAMGEVDAGFAFAFASAYAQWPQILKTSMPDEEKQMWMEKVLAGAKSGFAFTEANAGSDPAAMRTSAVYDEATNEWIINGTKCFCSGGPNADYFVVLGWTDKTQRPSKGITGFFVEADRPGISIGKKENKMGLHLSETSDVIFEDVRVPADHVIGEVNKGFGYALSSLKSASAVCNCCPCLGTAQAALDTAREYAKTRRQFGKRIIDHQAVGFMLADMETKVQAARCMLYTFLQTCDQNVDDQNIALMIKYYITDIANEVCNDAIQILGGYGYMKDYPVERYFRNVRIFRIFGGTNQIKRKNLAKAIAGKDTEARK